ncbi:aspartic peptidase domain-containing protein [Mycena latifolia]|nr:aspartic peptidase domain-containing protein [Mycena latifolia]
MPPSAWLLLFDAAAAFASSGRSEQSQSGSDLSTTNPIHFPLVHRTSRPMLPRDYVTVARDCYGFTNAGMPSRRDRIRRQDLNLIDQSLDSVYLVNILVGTPSQIVEIMVDTGSADLWLAQSPCSDCPSSSTLYDSTASSTFSQNKTNTMTITYASGDTVSGTVATDTVQIGPYTVASQAFLKVNDISGGILSGPEAGVLGLAFGAVASTTKTPFWQAALAQAGSAEIALWLKRNAQNEGSGGTFTFGGTNPALFAGEIEFLDLAVPSTTGFWQLNISGITVQGKAVKIGSGASAVSIIDTALGGIGGPAEDVKAIWAAVPGSTVSSGIYQFPCNTQLNITISFGGKAWPIDPADMNLGRASNDTCNGAIYEAGDTVNPSGPNWFIGTAFLKNVYSVFRQSPPSIGFAQLSTQAVGSESSSTTSSRSSSSGSSSTAVSTSSSDTPSNRPSGGTLPNSTKKSNHGAIVGGVFGALAVILIGLGVWFCIRRRRSMSSAEDQNRITAFSNDQTQSRADRGPVSSKQRPAMRALSSVNREPTAALQHNDSHPTAEGLVSTDGGRGPLPALVRRDSEHSPHISPSVEEADPRYPTTILSPDRAGQGVGRGVTDPVLNELRSLRAEVRRLATERTHPDAPPSYGHHDDAGD